MTDYLPLSSQQLETIHRSTKGIISRIPRGLENLKCVRITHEASSEELHVWATDRFCVLHLVLYTAPLVVDVSTCVDMTDLAYALGQAKADSHLTVKLTADMLRLGTVRGEGSSLKLLADQLPSVERLVHLVQGGPAFGDVHEGSVFNLGVTAKVAVGVRLSQETAKEGSEAPWAMAQKGVHPGEDERLGMLYLRRDNRHRAGDPEREPWLGVEYAEVWQMPITPNG